MDPFLPTDFEEFEFAPNGQLVNEATNLTALALQLALVFFGAVFLLTEVK